MLITLSTVLKFRTMTIACVSHLPTFGVPVSSLDVNLHPFTVICYMFVHVIESQTSL